MAAHGQAHRETHREPYSGHFQICRGHHNVSFRVLTRHCCHDIHEQLHDSSIDNEVIQS
jgi:hypothetical protein